MIPVTKSEKENIIKRFPEAHIVRTMKQKSSRHRYYCAEEEYIMNFLNKLRTESGNVNES